MVKVKNISTRPFMFNGVMMTPGQEINLPESYDIEGIPLNQKRRLMFSDELSPKTTRIREEVSPVLKEENNKTEDDLNG